MLDSLLNLPQSQRDAAYDNTAAVESSAQQLATFNARSKALVIRTEGQLDVPYGPAERQCFDYFGGAPGMPTLLFVHGGYWQMRHKNTFRFVVEGALEHGFNGALIGYTLAPEASLTVIVDQVRQGVSAVRQHAQSRGGSDEVLLCGWSAGAHLAAMALGSEGVKAGLGMSGIYDLAPLRCTYLNDALRLTSAEVESLSPLGLLPVAKPFVVAYGANELPQLRAQSAEFAKHRALAPGSFHVIEGADHFSILDSIAEAEGPLLKSLLALA